MRETNSNTYFQQWLEQLDRMFIGKQKNELYKPRPNRPLWVIYNSGKIHCFPKLLSSSHISST